MNCKLNKMSSTGSFGTHVSEDVLSFYFISGINGRTPVFLDSIEK